MKPVGERIILLALLSIFFIYKIIAALVEQNQADLILWSLILIIYLISLVILYFVMKKKLEKSV
ncbi:MAG: hypothetical protein KGD57_04545 [Candidatus Lokiarchaeota archaeon]|nr:hypothetical protein [Candidatus Lokiarchaeota archaeon]